MLRVPSNPTLHVLVCQKPNFSVCIFYSNPTDSLHTHPGATYWPTHEKKNVNAACCCPALELPSLRPPASRTSPLRSTVPSLRPAPTINAGKAVTRAPEASRTVPDFSISPSFRPDESRTTPFDSMFAARRHSPGPHGRGACAPCLRPEASRTAPPFSNSPTFRPPESRQVPAESRE